MDELKPIVQELAFQPLAFLGGLTSGLLRLNLDQDPLKTWLEKQGAVVPEPSDRDRGGKSEGPQSISID